VEMTGGDLDADLAVIAPNYPAARPVVGDARIGLNLLPGPSSAKRARRAAGVRSRGRQWQGPGKKRHISAAAIGLADRGQVISGSGRKAAASQRSFPRSGLSSGCPEAAADLGSLPRGRRAKLLGGRLGAGTVRDESFRAREPGPLRRAHRGSDHAATAVVCQTLRLASRSAVNPQLIRRGRRQRRSRRTPPPGWQGHREAVPAWQRGPAAGASRPGR
jgi:hypothetical protein